MLRARQATKISASLRAVITPHLRVCHLPPFLLPQSARPPKSASILYHYTTLYHPKFSGQALQDLERQ
jgi:hypothetical protein